LQIINQLRKRNYSFSQIEYLYREGIAAREMLIKTSCFDLHHGTISKNKKELQYFIAVRLKEEKSE
jgi:hypothetical protein